MVSGLSPMPMPIPAAIVGKVTAGALPRPVLMGTAIVLHLGYGAFWGGILAAVGRVTLWCGIALGLFLWLVMQVMVLPFLGWGLFGASQNLRIAPATLLLHLVYGVTLGWLMDRGPQDTLTGRPV